MKQGVATVISKAKKVIACCTSLIDSFTNCVATASERFEGHALDPHNKHIHLLGGGLPQQTDASRVKLGLVSRYFTWCSRVRVGTIESWRESCLDVKKKQKKCLTRLRNRPTQSLPSLLSLEKSTIPKQWQWKILSPLSCRQRPKLSSRESAAPMDPAPSR